jgi:hypothetical protein
MNTARAEFAALVRWLVVPSVVLSAVPSSSLGPNGFQNHKKGDHQVAFLL